MHQGGDQIGGAIALEDLVEEFEDVAEEIETRGTLQDEADALGNGRRGRRVGFDDLAAIGRGHGGKHGAIFDQRHR